VKPLSVPMALRARPTFPVGPFQVTMRTVWVVSAVSPLVLLALHMPAGGATKVTVAVTILAFAYVLSLPEREGVWIGTYVFYLWLDPALPRVIRGSRGRAVAVRRIGRRHLEVGAADRAPMGLPGALSRWATLPRLLRTGDGLLEKTPGTWCAILRLEGPVDAPQTAEYAAWCTRVLSWITALDCPVQLYAEATHYERSQAEQAFLERVRDLEDTALVEQERALVGEQALSSLILRHYVVFFPRWAGRDGIPTTARLSKILETVNATESDAARLRDVAVRQAANLRLEAKPLAADAIHELLRRTPLGSPDGTFFDGEFVMAGRYHRYASLSGLPSTIHSGAVISALTRAHVRGGVSLFMFPVDSVQARRELKDQRGIYQAMWKNTQSRDAELLLHHASSLDDMLLTKKTTAIRISMAMHVHAEDPVVADDSMERLQSAMMQEGLEVQRVTMPSFTVAVAASPAGAPLSRDIFMTTAEVVAYLLPAVGTPFGNPADPFVGRNAAINSSVYFNVFARQNYSALIVGSAGSGKSVAAKSLLVRHALHGTRVTVIDPESEYREVIQALGGTYIELGEHSLNALGIDPSVPADEAAEWVVPILSIMGGEEQGYENNRPARHLTGADKAWLHQEVAQFFVDWRRAHSVHGELPILADFIDYLETEAMARVNQLNVPGRARRCADISQRLRGYTLGRKGAVFNRHDTCSLSGRAVGIGLYALANQFRADLTPALAFVLSSVLADLARVRGKRIIMVDEAHKILVDPDAGDVLAQVVRTARKRGGGVWMASQSVRDFIGTDRRSGSPSPGEVLATVASTKLILGVEEAVASGLQRTFDLTERELVAVTREKLRGRGVLISDNERAVVDVVPGDHLMPLVHTTSVDDEPVVPERVLRLPRLLAAGGTRR
jgi:TraG P-loop domain